MTDWKPITTVPFHRDVALQVIDRFGERELGFPCCRTEAGWVNSQLNLPLSLGVKPVAWREWPQEI
jgi:hypothetical protein